MLESNSVKQILSYESHQQTNDAENVGDGKKIQVVFIVKNNDDLNNLMSPVDTSLSEDGYGGLIETANIFNHN